MKNFFEKFLKLLILKTCQENCPAEEKCQNKAFTNMSYPKIDVFRTTWGGNGLKALEKIKNGQFVIEYVGT